MGAARVPGKLPATACAPGKTNRPALAYCSLQIYGFDAAGVGFSAAGGGAFGFRIGPDGSGTGVGAPCNFASKNFLRDCASTLFGSRWSVFSVSASAALRLPLFW